MNVHETKSFTLTTSAETADGDGLDLEELVAHALLLESQCTVQATVPPGVLLRVGASATHARVLVTGGALPSGTVLSGMLSVVSARP